MRQQTLLRVSIAGTIGALLVLAMGCSLLDKLRNKNSRRTKDSVEPAEGRMEKTHESADGLEKKNFTCKTSEEMMKPAEPRSQEPSDVDADTESALGA